MILFLVVVYATMISAGFYIAYWIFPPTTSDLVKEFGVRAGIVATVSGAVVSVIASLLTLKRQIAAAQNLEGVKGQIAQQTDFVKLALSNKVDAYNKIIIAVGKCYDELHRIIVNAAVQDIFNINDAVGQLKSGWRTDLTQEYQSIWNQYAPTFGQSVQKLRDRSPFSKS